MSSFWNRGPHHHSGLPITTGFADLSRDVDDVHDAELGRSTKFHTPLQREYYLKRHPQMVGKLPPVADPNRIPAWDNASTVAGEPADLRLRANVAHATLRCLPIIRRCSTPRRSPKPRQL